MKYEGTEFSLTDNFISKYKGKQPKFGPLGYFTYKRTYARPISKNKSEEFWQTLRRVVEGCYLIQKRHCKELHLPWNERKAQKSAQEMYRRMWEFKFLPPGRGLWAMGTEFVFKKGSACLNNCGYVSSENIDMDFSGPFVWLMDMSMLGVGVGFDIDGANKEVYLKQPRMIKDTHEVEDSREGWVSLFKRILDSYSGKDSLPEKVDYSKIRAEGEEIKGFGGLAPGPKPLMELYDKTVSLLDKYVKEEKPVDSTLIVDLMNFAGAAVVAGGVRRSSEIALGTIDDEEFLHLKDPNNLSNPKLSRWASNNSLTLETGTNYSEIARQISVNGEPGAFWLENARKYGRLMDPPDNRDYRCRGLNPCVVSDTLVAVADGRGSVSIGELAKEGKDVPIYCYNGEDLSIEWGRNPRKTGEKVRTVKVVLDNGETIKVTPNHKFLVNHRGNISEVEAQDLKYGDSLLMLTRYIPDGRSESRADRYIGFSFKGISYYEHEMIAKFFLGSPEGKTHVHHKDGNRVNNNIENLEIYDPAVHLSHHSNGEDNPNAWEISNDEMYNVGTQLCNQLNRRFSCKEWKEYATKNNLPAVFTRYRKDHLGTIMDFSRECARLAGVDIFLNMEIFRKQRKNVKNLKRDTKKEKKYDKDKTIRKLIDMGYTVTVENNKAYVTKVCEGCGSEFLIPAVRREVSFCSLRCYNINGRNYNKNKQGMHQFWDKEREIRRNNQLEVYHTLKNKLNREPMKKEWELKCKEKGIPFRMCYKGSPFYSFTELREVANNNHKVLTVAPGDIEDVYNITVDNFHNLFIGGFSEQTRKGRSCIRYFGSMQCGEQSLETTELCCLAETFPSKHNTMEDYLETLRYAYLYAKTVTLIPTHDARTNAVMFRNRRIGISQSGIIDNMNKIGIRTHLNWCDSGYKEIKRWDDVYSEWLCVPKSIKKTTVKPSGTVSLLPGVSPGIHFPHSEYYIRRVRVSKFSSLGAIMREAGYKVEPDKNQPDYTEVIEFPVKEKYFSRRKEDVSMYEQLELAAQMQAYWSDNQVSITVTAVEGELRDLEYVLPLYESRLKSVSFLPLYDHKYEQAPYEEIDEKTYDKMIKNLKKPKLNVDTPDQQRDAYCDGDTCII